MHVLAVLVLSLISFQMAGTEPASPAGPAPARPQVEPVAAASLQHDPGQELVQARCSSCHGLSRFAGEQRTGAQWAETVTRMRDYCADLADEEYPVIVAFLTRTQGPAVPH
jgi:cytochrome c5